LLRVIFYYLTLKKKSKNGKELRHGCILWDLILCYRVQYPQIVHASFIIIVYDYICIHLSCLSIVFFYVIIRCIANRFRTLFHICFGKLILQPVCLFGLIELGWFYPRAIFNKLHGETTLIVYHLISIEVKHIEKNDVTYICIRNVRKNIILSYNGDNKMT